MRTTLFLWRATFRSLLPFSILAGLLVALVSFCPALAAPIIFNATESARPGGPDPFDLQAPWGADFAPFPDNVYNVQTDPRLSDTVVGDGSVRVNFQPAWPPGSGGHVLRCQCLGARRAPLPDGL